MAFEVVLVVVAPEVQVEVALGRPGQGWVPQKIVQVRIGSACDAGIP